MTNLSGRLLTLRSPGSPTLWSQRDFDNGWTGTGQRCKPLEWETGVSGKRVGIRHPTDEDKPVKKVFDIPNE